MEENAHKEEGDITIEDDAAIDAGDELEVVEEETRAKEKLVRLKKELAQCRTERQEYLDGWQRAKADYVNALKRFEEEKDSLRRTTLASVVQELLSALDSLERARKTQDLPEGFQAIGKQFAAAFEKLGVVRIPAAVGDPFNPAIHEALGQDETDERKRDETLSAVLEDGWQVEDKIIRPTKVRVARYRAGES